MGLPVEEVRVWHVATGAGPIAEPGEGSIEDLLAAPGGLLGRVGQTAISRQHGIRQEVEFEHVGDESVQHEGRRFLPAELVDDHRIALAVVPGQDAVQKRGLAAPARPKHGNKLAMCYFSTEVDYGVDATRKGLADVGQDDVELRHSGATVVGQLTQSFGGGEYQTPDRLEWHLIDHAALIKISQ